MNRLRAKIKNHWAEDRSCSLQVFFFLTFQNVYFNKDKVHKQLGKLVEKLTKIHKLGATSVHLNFLYFIFFLQNTY